jgi:hypothetical protein
MLYVVVATLLLLAVPADAFAWGAGIHLQLGSTVLANLTAIRPAIAAIISEFPYDFLYGCIAADITLGKKFTHYLLNCHRWQIGQKVLAQAATGPQKACAYGYLCHLAADTVAHNYYVPYKTIRSFTSMTMKHAYWEMRFETFVEKEVWEKGREVAIKNDPNNDKLLRKVLADTIFSFGTNKRIFNSIMLVSRLEKWQKVLQTVHDSSRYTVEEDDKDDFMALALDAVYDLLNDETNSPFLKADPTGERALESAEAMRKNLRLLYRSGKLQKEQALQQLEAIKKELRASLWEPERLNHLHCGK